MGEESVDICVMIHICIGSVVRVSGLLIVRTVKHVFITISFAPLQTRIATPINKLPYGYYTSLFASCRYPYLPGIMPSSIRTRKTMQGQNHNVS